jgi:hypothetical protein
MPVHLQKRSGIELRYGQQASPHQVDRKCMDYPHRQAVKVVGAGGVDSCKC